MICLIDLVDEALRVQIDDVVLFLPAVELEVTALERRDDVQPVAFVAAGLSHEAAFIVRQGIQRLRKEHRSANPRVREGLSGAFSGQGA